MKSQDKQEKKSLLDFFERKKKPVIGDEVTPKTIRHVERPIKLPFLATPC